MARKPIHYGRLSALGALVVLCVVVVSTAQASSVRVYEQDTVIPTYLAGAPEKSPMFFFGRQSQGAEGRIYPYPLYDTLTGKKVDKSYKLVYLENEYVKVGILPAIGGRIFEAIDKTNGYHFFYRQHVIKPALIGLIGAWISGGVEWNIPHHHRASTFLPVQYRIVENDDGSKTVWVGELELRHQMRWAVGYTLRPGKSYLEASIRIVNRTPVVNSMLCFANAAVHVNNDYQVIFPPSTQFVTHHHKREFTTWPIATTRYGGYDFRPGTDVSWLKNHISANSMFAWNYADDFFAGYDHGKHAGTMSVADHHIVPGKKLWTWGNGPRGRMWDKILTDEDGPYIELMVGAYSDNQPDYSWLQPFEVKSFSMFWYPFRQIGGVKNANLDAAVNLEIGAGGAARVGFSTTAPHQGATVRLRAGGKVVLEESVDIDPGKPYLKEVPIPPGTKAADLRASIRAGGKELVSYTPIVLKPEPMPQPDRPPPGPGEIKTSEELYLTGLRIEQFHDPALEPEPYWDEALRRDAGDARVHAALGIRQFKQARYVEAEAHLRKALERLTAGYAAPRDGEPYYYLGLVLREQGRDAEASDAFFKATWSLAWRGPGYFALAELATKRRDLAAALDLVDRSLESNALSTRALNLKATVLRHLERPQEALEVLAIATSKGDPLDVRSMAERWLATRDSRDARTLTDTMLAHPATAAEAAAEFQSAGLWDDGEAVLARLFADAPEWSRLSPMVLYDLAFFADKLGAEKQAIEYRRLARKTSPDYGFPFQSEAIEVLRSAIKADPSDPRAPYFLGNLVFDWQPEEAVKLWEKSAALDPSLAMVHRNLAIAWSHRPRGNDLGKAVVALEKAVSLPDASPLHCAELDELYQAAGMAPEQRLRMFEKHQEIVAQRAEALSREIALLVFAGRYDDAIRLMTGRQFEVWEGGSLSVAEDWVNAHILRGHRRRAEGRFQEALEDFRSAGQIPDNLPSDQGSDNAHTAEIAYANGLVYEAMGEKERAHKAFEQAAHVDYGEPRRGGYAAVSKRSIARYGQGLALMKLGRAGAAEGIFRALVENARHALENPLKIDPTAAAATQQAERDRLAQAHYVAGLGALGLWQRDESRREMAECLEISPDHLGAKTTLAELTGKE